MTENSPTTLLLDLNDKEHFMRLGDPTGYYFASRYLKGGWNEWLKLLDNPETSTVIGNWRDELAAKLSADSLARIIDAAQGETRDALGANKYIYETLTKDKEKKSSVGRPSKEAISREAQALVEEDKIREEAFKRIFNAQEEKEEDEV
jgi:hypothetical protein